MIGPFGHCSSFKISGCHTRWSDFVETVQLRVAKQP
jgi:hypothetical protein